MVGEARTLHQRVRKDVERWPEEALLPIMQYSMEQKRLLEHRIRKPAPTLIQQKVVNISGIA